MTRTLLTLTVGVMAVFGLAGAARSTCAEQTHDSTAAAEDPDRGGGRGMGLEVLEWNQIFIDTLIATNTANSSSQRLGAIVHTAIFDAFNGIEQRYTPIFVQTKAPDASSRRAAVIAAAHTALARPVPVPTSGARCQLYGVARGAERRLRRPRPLAETRGQVHETYRARHRLGNRGGAGRARLARDRWIQRELSSVHRWDRGRPVAADAAGVRRDERSGVGVHRDVRPDHQHPVRAGTAAKSDERDGYTDDFNAVKALGRKTGSTRTDDQTALALFWDGNASVHWNQAANQIARAHHLSMSDGQPAARGPEHRDGRHGVHDLERQAILRRRSERSDLAAGDLDPAGGHGRQSGHGFRSGLAAAHQPRRRTRNTLPGIPARMARLRPCSSATSDDDRRLR